MVLVLESARSAPAPPQRVPEPGHWALVEYLQLDGHLFGFTVVDGLARLRPLVGVDVVTDLVERVAFGLRRLLGGCTSTAGEAALTLCRTAAARLDELVLRPLAGLAARPLVIVPTGPLHGLPWAVLPSCAGRLVTVTQSVAVSVTGPVSARRRGVGGVAVIAGPQLCAAAREAGAVSRIHGCAPVTGSDATVATTMSHLTGAQIAHLAAHGRLSAERPQHSAIMLADGPLTVEHVQQLRHAPRTMVLAVCDGGRPVLRAGDEPLGLATAFLARGTTRVIAPLLPVPDVETTPLMIELHRSLATGMPAAAALARAQRAVIGASVRVAAVAASFTCIGAGAVPFERAPLRACSDIRG